MFKKIIFLLSFVFGLLVVWDVFLQLSPDKNTPLNYWFNTGFAVLYFLGGLVGVFGGLKFSLKSLVGRGLIFIGAGLLSYSVGLFIWTYYNLFLNVEIPSPSFADIFFIVLFIPLAGIGFLNIIRIFGQNITRRHVIEGLVIFIISTILVVGFAIRPEFSGDMPLINNLVNAAYPIGDSILLSLAIIAFRIGAGKMQRGLKILAWGFLVQVIADYFYSYSVAHEFYWNGGIADLGYAISSFLIGLGVINIFNDFNTPA